MRGHTVSSGEQRDPANRHSSPGRAPTSAMKRCEGIDGQGGCDAWLATGHPPLCSHCFKQQRKQQEREEPKAYDGTLAMKPKRQR